MLFYYDCYARGDAGYNFAGRRWPQGIDTERSNTNGLGLLWNLCTNVYGDNASVEQRRESRFMVRGLFGGTVTAAGIAGPEYDSHGRIGTHVDFVLCLPQTDEERTAELDPQRLFELVEQKNAPGYRQNLPAASLCTARGGAAVPPEWAPMLYSMAFADARLLVFNAADTNMVTQTAMQICAALPVPRRREFSFITYAVDWMRIQDAGLRVMAVQQPASCQNEIYRLEQQGRGVWAGLDLSGGECISSRQTLTAGESYLRRTYPMLVQRNRQSLPDLCGNWFMQTAAAECPGVQPVTAIAAGMMLQAARGNVRDLFPTVPEKQEVFEALDHGIKN